METGKSNPDFTCFGKTDSKAYSDKQHLVLVDESSQILFSIIDSAHNECIGLCGFEGSNSTTHLPDHLKQKIDRSALLNYKYSRVNLVFTGRECTLIPEEVFKESHQEDYIEHLFSNAVSGKVFHSFIPSIGSYLVYKVNDQRYSFYKEKYPASHIYHHAALLIDGLHQKSINSSKGLIHAHFFKQHFELYAFSKGQLIFFNSFIYHTSEEIAYYLLYAMKQWELDFEQLSISGFLTAESDDLYWLKKYIKTIINLDSDHMLPFPASIETPSKYITLLNRNWCE